MLRAHFGLTQAMLADWLGVARSSLALAELGYQSDTSELGGQNARLTLASQGLVYDGTGGSFRAPSALPEPLPDVAELSYRLRQCQAKIQGLELQLTILSRRAAPYVARLAAAPALRAYPGPIANPEDKTNWLTIFELEARRQLRNNCGATARLLLEARLAGMQREAELLTEALAAGISGNTQ
ncbi:hypothetical protein [Hymenobacter lapidiphilus]|uniref:Uncharacterized protein n=1 Tax=Hymenobacter lapidiphilus TaxID=2608003 RepID=A0A7Y7PRM7_9BACT|nr:hypothetical protein [Hymenobacter lapidiphilus]NVO32783.1 hypothetical protein [Hymenobacter lapidiphilus]